MAEFNAKNYREPLEWDEEALKIYNAEKPSKKPSAPLGNLMEALRQGIPENTICSMVCGGRKCRFCAAPPAGKQQEEQAIDGLYSSWVTPNIMAMARPTHEHVKKFDVFAQFKDVEPAVMLINRRNIGAVINLEQSGEHAHCGCGLEEDGVFSYKPEQLMRSKIYFFNYPWPDFSVGSVSFVLDAVKVMQQALHSGKVAVHCHAGLGRTGLLIACYLLFANNMGPDEVISYVRSKRKGSIQSKIQVDTIHAFYDFLRPARVIYCSISHDQMPLLTISLAVDRQQRLLHGQEARDLKFVPKIVSTCCNRLLDLAGRHVPSATHTMLLLVRQRSRGDRLSDVGSSSTSLSAGDIDSFSRVAPTTQEHNVAKMSSVSQLSTASKKAHNTSDVSNGHSYTGEDEDGWNLEFTGNISKRCEIVAHAMGQQDYTAQAQDEIDQWKHSINAGPLAWSSLTAVKDPSIVSGLMWQWLEHLQEPLLQTQDISALTADTIHSPWEALNLLSKPCHYTLEYVCRTLALLLPLSGECESALVQRVLSVFTHQHVSLDTVDIQSSERKRVDTLAPATASRLIYFVACLLHDSYIEWELLCAKHTSQLQTRRSLHD